MWAEQIGCARMGKDVLGKEKNSSKSSEEGKQGLHPACRLYKGRYIKRREVAKKR